MSQPQAFDPLAASYDKSFTHTTIGTYLRGIVQSRLSQHFTAGDHILELGCGTGEDALWLAERGLHVTATDVSESMLATAKAKCAGNPRVQVEMLDLRRLPVTASTSFDGVYSNFGPLNCLSEWRTLAVWLAQRVKKGGIVGLCVMSPYCLWEPVWHGLHGNWRTATRRWHKSTTFQPDDMSEPIEVTYPTITHMTDDFAPHFHRTFVRGIGVFLPPSDVYGAIEKRPWLLKRLMGLEQRFGASPKLALLADHYWIELVRK